MAQMIIKICMPFNGGWSTEPVAIGFKLQSNQNDNNLFAILTNQLTTYMGAGSAGGSEGTGGG